MSGIQQKILWLFIFQQTAGPIKSIPLPCSSQIYLQSRLQVFNFPGLLPEPYIMKPDLLQCLFKLKGGRGPAAFPMKTKKFPERAARNIQGTLSYGNIPGRSLIPSAISFPSVGECVQKVNPLSLPIPLPGNPEFQIAVHYRACNKRAATGGCHNPSLNCIPPHLQG